jgi:elongation of very long chain fatty acids protein 4
MESTTLLETAPLLSNNVERHQKKESTPLVKGKNEEVDSPISMGLIKPLAVTLVYLWALRFIVRETGTAKDLPAVFMEASIWAPITATIVYLGFLYFGMRYMSDKEPFEITSYMFVYNLYQAILNVWAFVSFVRILYEKSLPIWGSPVDDSKEGYEMAFLIWIHYINKYVELLDTVFMVLRKKNMQVSFLHVYHHVLLVWSWFVVCKVCVGGDAYFGACVNSFIHVVMYSYYLCALLGIKVPFKFIITQMQMAQFALCLSHSVFCVFNGNVPIGLPLLQAFVMINMLVLFGMFYKDTFGTKKPKELANKPKVA